MIRKLTETQTQWGGRRRRPPHWGAAKGGACVSDYLINIYGYSLYMDDIWIISWFNHTAFDANPIWKSPICGHEGMPGPY